MIDANFCPLCGLGEENIFHLFVSCSFTQSIWQIIGGLLKTNTGWNNDTLSDCFLDWKHNNPYWIFEGSLLNVFATRLKGLNAFFESGLVLLTRCNILKNHRVLKELAPAHKLMGFFDGASQLESRLCGAGAILWMDEFSFYKLWMNCNPGSNTKGELLSLWVLLQFTRSLGLDGIHIYGDSSIIIDWAKGIQRINLLYLDPWLKRIRNLICGFNNISFSHIFRE